MTPKTLISGLARVLEELEKLGQDTEYIGLRDACRELRGQLRFPYGTLLVLTADERKALLQIMKNAADSSWFNRMKSHEWEIFYRLWDRIKALDRTDE